jgi:hypothetical protein
MLHCCWHWSLHISSCIVSPACTDSANDPLHSSWAIALSTYAGDTMEHHLSCCVKGPFSVSCHYTVDGFQRSNYMTFHFHCQKWWESSTRRFHFQMRIRTQWKEWRIQRFKFSGMPFRIEHVDTFSGWQRMFKSYLWLLLKETRHLGNKTLSWQDFYPAAVV